jgi:hypothetical protein
MPLLCDHRHSDGKANPDACKLQRQLSRYQTTQTNGSSSPGLLRAIAEK